MLTKIVVVVGTNKELFEGNIEARTNEGGKLGPISNPDEPTLYVYDKDQDNMQIAAFVKYDYWRITK